MQVGDSEALVRLHSCRSRETFPTLTSPTDHWCRVPANLEQHVIRGHAYNHGEDKIRADFEIGRGMMMLVDAGIKIIYVIRERICPEFMDGRNTHLSHQIRNPWTSGSY